MFELLPLQMPGGPELLVILLIVLLPLLILGAIGYVLITRIRGLPDPSRVNELEREVTSLRERVAELDDDDGRDDFADDGGRDDFADDGGRDDFEDRGRERTE